MDGLRQLFCNCSDRQVLENFIMFDMPHAQHLRGRALAYGEDRILLQTRAQLLEAEGYRTDMAFDVKEALAFITARQPYDVVVLCHTSKKEALTAIRAALEAYSVPQPLYVLNGSEAPRRFIAEVSRLTGMPSLVDQD